MREFEEKIISVLKGNRKNKGITLIALVITIIVLLILVGISISMLSGDNSILSRTTDAKENTVVEQEKEQVELAYISATAKNLGDNISQQNLQDELDSMFGDTGKDDIYKKTAVTTNTDGTYNVHYNETNHDYNVNNGQVAKIDDPSAILYRSKIKSAFVVDNKLYIFKANGEFVKSGHATPTNERRIWII